VGEKGWLKTNDRMITQFSLTGSQGTIFDRDFHTLRPKVSILFNVK